jgi:ureidoacrylate peracid hydrolase
MDPSFADLVDPRHTALLVIDNQNDSCHPDGVYAKTGRDISLRRQAAHNTAEFLPAVRQHGVPIIFLKFNQNASNQSPTWLRRSNGMREAACIEGTWGEDFYAAHPQEGDAVVVKHRYSAFIGTDLEMILHSKGITTLLLTGGGTNVCVQATAMDGFMLDYDIVVVADCCGTPTIEDHEPALKRMADLCATVVQSTDLLEIWSRRAVAASA